MFLITGICWRALNYSFELAILLACLVVAIVVYTQHKTILLYVVLSTIFFIFGICLYSQQIRVYASREQKLANIEKTDAIVENIQKIDSPSRFRFKTLLWLKDENARIQVFTGKDVNCQVDDRIEIENLRFKKPSDNKFRHFLMKENIHGCYFSSTLDHIIKYRPLFSIKRRCWIVKNNMLTRLKRKLTPQTFAFWSVLFLGDKNFDKKHINEIKNNCKNWGISHMLARSGLHLMLFIFLWIFLLKAVPCSIFLKQWILIVLVIVYASLSTASISFLRGIGTFFIYKFCTLHHLDIRPLYVINLMCMATLFFNPAQLFYLDFQLSYSLTAALALFSELNLKKKLLIHF